MSTEELLQRTSKPPFRIERGILADKGQLFIVADESGNKYKQNICRLGYAYTKDGDDARGFNAELIARAVNSFEASQGLLRDAALQFARLEGENLTAYARTFAALAEKHLANNTEH